MGGWHFFRPPVCLFTFKNRLKVLSIVFRLTLIAMEVMICLAALCTGGTVPGHFLSFSFILSLARGGDVSK